MHNIADNLHKVMRRIDFSVNNSKFPAKKPLLLAVSKGQPKEDVLEAYRCGLREFGENYLQEALAKIDALRDLKDIHWHFLGPIQSNKTRPIAEHFSWVHSVERFRIAERLSRQRPDNLPPLNLCLQINIDNSPSKAGIHPEEALELAMAISALPRLKLRGLMAIPDPHGDDPGRPFRALCNLLDKLKTSRPVLASLDTLSMGMSGDLEAAIAEGATIVRVGTDIFGPRKPKPPSTPVP